jgi:hypothetical protein
MSYAALPNVAFSSPPTAALATTPAGKAVPINALTWINAGVGVPRYQRSKSGDRGRGRRTYQREENVTEIPKAPPGTCFQIRGRPLAAMPRCLREVPRPLNNHGGNGAMAMAGRDETLSDSRNWRDNQHGWLTQNRENHKSSKDAPFSNKFSRAMSP